MLLDYLLRPSAVQLHFGSTIVVSKKYIVVELIGICRSTEIASDFR